MKTKERLSASKTKGLIRFMNLEKSYLQLQKWPWGRRIFSCFVTFTAPYFGTINPLVEELTPGYCRISMKKRRRVYNHIKTVHAIAMCNLCELTMGLAVEAGLPKNLRWIPKSMTTNYLLKATTDLVAETRILDIKNWTPGENPVLVEVKDQSQQVVMTATIVLWITEKK